MQLKHIQMRNARALYYGVPKIWAPTIAVILSKKYLALFMKVVDTM